MQKRVILGLDVSTSITGVCLLDERIEEGDVLHPRLVLDNINFKKCKSLWEKVDFARDFFKHSHDEYAWNPDVIVVEEPLLGFSKGKSSASTITTLMRFNGIVSSIVRDVFHVDPTYISSATARKLCGVKLQQTKKCGKKQKDQVFEFMCEHDLKGFVWDKKKCGSPVDASKDMTDAYVIARAASLM